MSNNQPQLIKKYFNLLVDEFIKDPKNKNIIIVFKQQLGKNIGGLTGLKKVGDKYTYAIWFLNQYSGNESLRRAVVHEFTHLYLASVGNLNHQHDDNFYSKMDYFEDWLDKNQGLNPRKYKGDDWDQHIDANRKEERKEQFQSISPDDFPKPLEDKYELGITAFKGIVLLGLILFAFWIFGGCFKNLWNNSKRSRG